MKMAGGTSMETVSSMNRYDLHKIKPFHVGSRVSRAEHYIEETLRINPDFDTKILQGLGTVIEISRAFGEYELNLLTVDWDLGYPMKGVSPHLYTPNELRAIYE